MKRIKYYITQKRIYISCLIIFAFCISLISYTVYENKRKQEIIDKMSISFTEVKEVEYGTKYYDVKKDLVKGIKNATLNEVQEIDTSKVGEQTLKFILTQDNLEKEVEYKINIKDTKAPEIKCKEKLIQITVGDEFDIKSNIESVKDPIDGDIKENEKALQLNKKATDEYNKLKKEDIKGTTKIAEKSLNDFLIEDIKDKEEKTLYLKNCYYINSNVDTSKQGEYTVHIIAVDKNGLKIEKEYKVIIKEVKQSQNNTSSGSIFNSVGNSSSSGGATTATKGSISSVIATAQAQVGKPYVIGGRGPNSFDCDGLVMYAFNQNGYSMHITSSTAGYSIGTDLHNAQAGDIIVTPNHVRIYLGGSNSVQAKFEGVASGYDFELANWFLYHDYGDPNVSNPLVIEDIRRVR